MLNANAVLPSWRTRTGLLFLTGLLFALVWTAAAPRTAQDPAAHTTHEARPDTQTTVDNLRAFARLYGYVRFFHPSDAASAVDWDRFAIHGARQAMDAATPSELRETLDALFAPIAPTVQIYPADAAPPPPADVLTPADTAGLNLVAWQHRGVNLGNQGLYRSIRFHREIRIQRGSGFGSIAQNIEAAPYRGQQMRLRAAVKADVSGGGNQAQLWLRVDRPERQPGFFDNMGDRPVTESEWDVYEITGDVDEDAERIAFGGFLLGRGAAQFDDFQLAVRAHPDEAWTPVSIENAGFEEGESPVGWGARADGYAFATEPGDAHEGTQSLAVESVEEVHIARPLFEARPEAGEVVNKPLGRGLSAQIPLALYSRDGQTLRPDEAPSPGDLNAALGEVQLDTLTAEDEALRVGNAIIAWNVFQHFYPYFDVVDVDWDEVLTRTLQRTASDSSGEDFLQTLRWMVAQLDDGHGRVYHPRLDEQAGLPLQFDRVEDQIAVVAATDDEPAAACVQRGDVVTSVDGVPAEDVIQTSKRYISGSPQWTALRALTEFGRGERGTTVQLVLNRDGKEIECTLPRNHEGWLTKDRPRPVEALRDDVHYVDLTRVDMDTLNRHLNELAQADGIIFDVRGRPNVPRNILQHLSADTLRSAHWQTPQIIYPDREHVVGYDTTGRWIMPPLEPQFTGKIVFLTDERAISYAESIMGIVEHYALGEIVGRPTAGANGDINPFGLPGGYRVFWTGRRVVKHDGSQHHIVGIEPTVPVERTIEGVREGLDEDLEAALEVLETAAETPSR